ncbi:hypothetical protein GCM10010260_82500 [Streptomyces filipinensis]|uniref:Uncharacterized protein n=1 Tax=Streptomyces filipinensis TaxID=66887 RepID=A0A918ILJ7_9ACTN|nr:hypothetical protein GCM10010260_82500 [Streptomyces filipinensis]
MQEMGRVEGNRSMGEGEADADQPQQERQVSESDTAQQPDRDMEDTGQSVGPGEDGDLAALLAGRHDAQRGGQNEEEGAEHELGERDLYQ